MLLFRLAWNSLQVEPELRTLLPLCTFLVKAGVTGWPPHSALFVKRKSSKSRRMFVSTWTCYRRTIQWSACLGLVRVEQNRINDLQPQRICYDLFSVPVLRITTQMKHVDYRSICYKLLLLCGGTMQPLKILFGVWGDGIVFEVLASKQEDLSLTTNPC